MCYKYSNFDLVAYANYSTEFYYKCNYKNLSRKIEKSRNLSIDLFYCFLIKKIVLVLLSKLSNFKLTQHEVCVNARSKLDD